MLAVKNCYQLVSFNHCTANSFQVLYLIEAVDEYCIQSLPEFEGKKFQNAAKEGLKLDASEKAKERREALEKEFEPLLTWMKDEVLKDKVCNHQ